jgi:hypothetical protein
VILVYCEAPPLRWCRYHDRLPYPL